MGFLGLISVVITLPNIAVMTNCCKQVISVCTEKGSEFLEKNLFNIIFINKIEWNKMQPVDLFCA